MNIRYPISIVSENIDDTVASVAKLLGADTTTLVAEGPKVDDSSFVGPYRLVQDLYIQQAAFDKDSLRLLIDEKFDRTNNRGSNQFVAHGVYLPRSYSGTLPFLMLYKRVDALGGKPVLISENYMVPGELLVVPESSEVLALLFCNDGRVCGIPEEVRWFQWGCIESPAEIPSRAQSYKVNYEMEYDPGDFKNGPAVELDAPLLSLATISSRLLSPRHPAIQLYPVVQDDKMAELLDALKNCDAWVRRTGENHILYTQETFDLLEFSKRGDSPSVLRELVKQVQSEQLVMKIAALSGIEVSCLREVYAYRMRSNEFITRHADSTLGGQLLVRLNWLLQSPNGRDYDLRFWTGKECEKPVTRFRALPNSCTIFYVGDSTPHDLSPLPEECDKDRYNIVLTFGTR